MVAGEVASIAKTYRRISKCALNMYIDAYRSEGFALTGYAIPGCVEDGAWMLRENSSVVVVVAVAHPDLGKWAVLEFRYGIGASGVCGSIRLVFRSTDAPISRKVVVGKNQISKNSQKRLKTGKNRHSIINPL